MNLFGRKAQSSIEYLVIIGAVVVISLVVVGTLSTMTSADKGVSSAESKIYWKSQLVSITDAAVDQYGTGKFVVRNSQTDPVTITGLIFDNVLKSIVTPIVIPGNSDKTIIFTGLNPCQAATARQYAVSINYLSKDGLSKTISGKVKLEASCISPFMLSGWGYDFNSNLSAYVELADGNYVMVDTNANLASLLDVRLIDVNTTSVFGYSGGDQYFTVPEGVTTLNVKMWGAGGGGGYAGGWWYGYAGGGGGYTQATVSVTPGQQYMVMVGQGGNSGSNSNGYYMYGGGGANCPGWSDCRYGGSGGGMSALWYSGTPIAIAGGGGGGGSTASGWWDQAGGAGGGENGQVGS